MVSTVSALVPLLQTNILHKHTLTLSTYPAGFWHPTARKDCSIPLKPKNSHISFSCTVSSNTDKGALIFWEPLGADVPASLFQRWNCSSSSQSRSYPFIQFCSCYNSCNENFLPTQRESLTSKRHTQERKAFYLQHTAVCHLHNRSAVRNNCKHQGFTILSLGFWTFPAPSWLFHSLCFLAASAKEREKNTQSPRR